MTTAHDDPFERAAEREARFHRARPPVNGARPLLGLQAAWGVVLALHWWVAGGDGRLLTIHATVFALGLAFTLFASVSMLGGPTWGLIGSMTGWGVLLALHWMLAGGRTPFVTAHTIAFGLGVATTILMVAGTPRPMRRGPS